MIHAGSDEERNAAIDELAPFVKRDIKATIEAMDGLPVTVRLLDPPLHEFVPQAEEALAMEVRPAARIASLGRIGRRDHRAEEQIAIDVFPVHTAGEADDDVLQLLQGQLGSGLLNIG